MPIVLEKSEYHGRHFAARSTTREPHRYRRPSLLFQVGPGDGLVAGCHAARRRSPQAQEITYQQPAAALEVRRQRGCAGSEAGPCDAGSRSRKSRIYFLRRFFDYPITLSNDTVRKLGLWRIFRIGLSYLRSGLLSDPKREESGRVFHQPLRPAALSHVLQVLHGKGLGRALQRDQRRMGRAADQGAFDHQSARSTSCGKRSAPPPRRSGPKRHGNVADRAVPVSQVRPRPDVGRQSPSEVKATGGQILTSARGAAAAVERQPRSPHVEARDAETGQTSCFRAATIFSRPCRSRI